MGRRDQTLGIVGFNPTFQKSRLFPFSIASGYDGDGFLHKRLLRIRFLDYQLDTELAVFLSQLPGESGVADDSRHTV